MLTQADFENKALQIADDIFPFDEPPSHGNITALAAQLYQILTAHNAGAQEPVGVVHRPAPNGDDFSVEWFRPPENGARLYAQPQPTTDARKYEYAQPGSPEYDGAEAYQQFLEEMQLAPDDATMTDAAREIAQWQMKRRDDYTGEWNEWVNCRPETVNRYSGRAGFEFRALAEIERLERIGEEALSNIRDELQSIEEDEKERIAAQPQPTTDAARDVLAERKRQVEVEGWTTAHDDGANDVAAMADAAACYAMHAGQMLAGAYSTPCLQPHSLWPWDASWWKPTTPRRDLVKAGALILAEIERIDRIAEIERIEREGEA